MKKMLTIGTLLLTLTGVAQARPWDSVRRYETPAGTIIVRCFEGNLGDRGFRRGFTTFPDTKNERLSRDVEDFRILMAEKDLELRREFNKENPDWSKIEKIRIEMATERVKFRTKLEKQYYEEWKKQELQQKTNENSEKTAWMG